MRRLFTFTAVIISIIFLFAGHTYWKHKTTSLNVEKTSVKDAASSTSKGKKQAGESKTDEEKLAKAANWPENAQAAFEKAMLNKQPLKLAIVGSKALGEEANGWSVQLQNVLADTYGDTLDVKIFQHEEQSDQFIASGHDKEVAKFQPDIVLFEPFTLNDNGSVKAEDSHENIRSFISAVQKEKEGAVVILQPPHPIHNATYYPLEVEALEKFAGDNNLPFLNHWAKWPAVDNEQLRSYLLEDQSAPNEKGHEIWFTYLQEYFIADA